MVPQREYLCPATGEHLSIECSTNYTVLEWSIKFSNGHYSSRLVTHTSYVLLYGWWSSGATAIKYLKNSEPGEIPLISTLMISNVGDFVNGVEINCTGLQIEEIVYVTVFHVVTPPEVTVSERFGTTNITLDLIWTRENNDISYSVSTEPPAHLIITGDTSVRFLMHYNIVYNASIVAFRSPCNAAITTIGLHYCKF